MKNPLKLSKSGLNLILGTALLCVSLYAAQMHVQHKGITELYLGIEASCVDADYFVIQNRIYDCFFAGTINERAEALSEEWKQEFSADELMKKLFEIPSAVYPLPEERQFEKI